MQNKQLETVINDINTIRRILSIKCGYQNGNIITITGRKATRAEIRGIFDTELNEKVKENDRLLVFYSGHGESRKSKGSRPEKGYLTTYDTKHKGREIDWQTMLEMDEFIPYIEERISAKQILFLIDCCFSGMIQKSSEYTERVMNRGTSDMRRAAKKKSRQAYTAGGRDESILVASNVRPPVSIFVETLRRTLEQIDPREYPEEFLAASKLARKATTQVRQISINLCHEQNPTYYYFRNDEGGEFVFKQFSKKEIINAQKLPTTTLEPIEALVQNSDLVNFFKHENINAINRALEIKFPNGYSLKQLCNTISGIIINEESIIPYVYDMVKKTEFSIDDIVMYMVVNTLAIALYRQDFTPKLVEHSEMEGGE